MQPLRHGYSHDTRSDGAVVVKRFQGPDATVRWTNERDMLERVTGLVPVPEVLAAPTGELHLAHVAGTHGQELVDAGHAGPVLRACGAMLRRLAAAGVRHGDYGPNNMLLDPDTFVITAVLDWEWAEPGPPGVADLAWCEWIIRMHHPSETAALGELFAGYGSRPAWAERQEAMLIKCHQMLALFRPPDPTAPGYGRWRRNIATTARWNDLPES